MLIVGGYYEKANPSFETNETLAMLSARYWVLKGSAEIREM